MVLGTDPAVTVRGRLRAPNASVKVFDGLTTNVFHD
jgi:hypothetical protein